MDKILGKRSALNGAVIDILHDVGIEIVSPSFTNRRDIDLSPIIAEHYRPKSKDLDKDQKLEKVVFDKAEEAQSIEVYKEKLESIENSLKEKREQLEKANNDEQRAAIEQSIAKDESMMQRLEKRINEGVDELENKV